MGSLSNNQSQQLVIDLIQEHISLADQQQYLVENCRCPHVNDSRLQLQYIVGFMIGNELNQKNTQMKELYYHKIRMMRVELNTLSQKLEKFQEAMKLYADRYKGKKS